MSLDSLRQRLQELRLAAAGQEPRRFLPDRELRRVLVKHEVEAALKSGCFDIEDHKWENVALAVVTGGLKTFAILVELRLESELERFLENDILDTKLPLNDILLKGTIPLHASQFEQLQWDYVAFQFRKDRYHQVIPPACILPYTEQTSLRGGGYSRVYRVRIHAAYQNLLSNSEEKV